MLNLRGIDLNLLPVFEAAYEEPTLSRSKLNLARDTLGLRSLPVVVTPKAIPIKLVWAANNDSDAVQVFIRKQIGLASRAVAGRGLR